MSLIRLLYWCTTQKVTKMHDVNKNRNNMMKWIEVQMEYFYTSVSIEKDKHCTVLC